jgi:biotin-dependent carboxylase-like uncharacterized protein
VIRVGAPGTCSSLQDLGRLGCQALGIGTAGAMDAWAARVANALLDNEPGVPVLEMTLSGAELEVCEPNWFALTGADMQATCDGAPLPSCRPVWVERGSVLRFGAARHGCRAYLAVRSGFCAERVLGSAATDVRARIGGLQGRLLRRGDELACRAAAPAAPKLRRAPWFTIFARPPDVQPTLLLLPGPAWPLLSHEDRERLLGAPCVVGRDCDRMGLRLDPPLASAAALAPILSQGVVFGAVQLPPDGRPIVLGADRQTTGGYPLLGVVAGVDHAALAQLRPGDALRFRVGDIDAAQAAWRARERRFQRFRLGVQAWWRGEAACAQIST